MYVKKDRTIQFKLYYIHKINIKINWSKSSIVIILFLVPPTRSFYYSANLPTISPPLCVHYKTDSLVTKKVWSPHKRLHFLKLPNLCTVSDSNDMDSKVRCLSFGFLVLFLCFQLHLLSGAAARTLKITEKGANSIERMSLWTMKHEGPSPGGKGHRSRTDHTPTLRQLQDSGPSPGVGH